MAVYHLIKPYLDKITVAWVDTGNNAPELQTYMSELSKRVPRFVRYKSNQPKWVEQNGMPSDVVPVDNTPIGRMCTGDKEVKIVDYFTCCNANIWEPFRAVISKLGATAVITGQRSVDGHTIPYKSGQQHELGYHYYFPIDDWTDEQVVQYLREQGETDPRFDIHHSSIDCLTCTAFCKASPQRMQYLKANHPDHYNELVRRLKLIRGAVDQYLTGMDAVIDSKFEDTE